MLSPILSLSSCPVSLEKAFDASYYVGTDFQFFSIVQVVGRAGVGIDNVDLQAATEVGCLVVNAPTANTVAAAEHGISLLTAMARNVAQASASMKAGTNMFL